MNLTPIVTNKSKINEISFGAKVVFFNKILIGKNFCHEFLILRELPDVRHCFLQASYNETFIKKKT